MAWSVLLLLPFALSLALCRLLIAVSVRDAPDGARKLQAAPVPTAGGAGILFGIAVPLLAFGVLGGHDPITIAGGLATTQSYSDWVLFVLGLGVLGFLDDVVGLPALVKLLVMVAACAALATQLPAVDLAMPWWPEAGDTVAVVPPLMVAGLALWLLVFINAANFMDGADGLTMGCLAVMLAGIGIALLHAYLPLLEFIDRATWAILLTAPVAIMAIGGFLVWNLRGQLYAGDTGALAMGGLFAVLAAHTAAHVGIWYPLVLALPFLVDVGMTLVYRTIRRQPLLRPHREHAYQLFIRRGASPVRVSMLWWALCLACLIAATTILVREPSTPGYGAMLFAALASLGCLLWVWQRYALRSRSPSRPADPVELTPAVE